MGRKKWATKFRLQQVGKGNADAEVPLRLKYPENSRWKQDQEEVDGMARKRSDTGLVCIYLFP